MSYILIWLAVSFFFTGFFMDLSEGDTMPSFLMGFFWPITVPAAILFFLGIKLSELFKELGDIL